MTVVHFAQKLQVGTTFVVVEEVCGHGSLVAAGPYKLVDWEQHGLIALVEEGGERFTLGLEPGQPGVDEVVSTDASFVCTPQEFKGHVKHQPDCSCQ